MTRPLGIKVLLYPDYTALSPPIERKRQEGSTFLWDLEKGGVSGVHLQISAKLLVMKERTTATPHIAFEVRSERGIKGISTQKGAPRGPGSTQPPRSRH